MLTFNCKRTWINENSNLQKCKCDPRSNS